MRRPAVILACALGLLLGGCASDADADVTGKPDRGADATTSSPPPERSGQPQPRAVFLGDSYTEATLRGDGYVPATALGMGWTPFLAAVGGTGYVAPGPGDSAFSTRVDETVADDPDVVVVQGSTNDVGYPVEDVRAAARELYSVLAAELPDAAVVVVGPLDPPGVDRAGVDQIRAVLWAEADAAGLPFIDPVAEGWLDAGTGLYGDPVHPSQAGYDEYAAELVGALRTAGF